MPTGTRSLSICAGGITGSKRCVENFWFKVGLLSLFICLSIYLVVGFITHLHVYEAGSAHSSIILSGV